MKYIANGNFSIQWNETKVAYKKKPHNKNELTISFYEYVSKKVHILHSLNGDKKKILYL